eukprot:12412704-Karenia_brevis.AAC.1
MDKPAGGTRPIGWYRAFHRVYSKVRADLTAEWEASQDAGHIFGTGQGRTIEDLVWRQNFRAEEATSKQECAVCILHDLEKCYERIRRSDLAAEAIRFQYPITYLRMTISSYRSGRRILHNGLMHRPLYASRGIIAGASSATTELKLAMIRLLLDITCRHPM